MNIIFTHPTGNANAKAAVEGIAANNALAAFYTSVAVFHGTVPYRLAGLKPFAEFRKRSFANILQPYTNTKPLYELGRLLALKAGYTYLTRREQGIFSIDSIYRRLDRAVADRLLQRRSEQPSAVYAYEDGALFTFRAAKKNRVASLYDLPIGYWRAARLVMEQERQRWPDWASTLGGLNDSDDKLARKDEELRLADHVFVATKFTAKTLEMFPGKLGPVHIVPYGYPTVAEERSYPVLRQRKLKLLFVGGLSQRKGIADVFSVANNLKKYVTLTVVGKKPTDHCDALNAALTENEWIESLPHDKILSLMRSHDVLLFPSLFEGFGLVITEAMSQGTPVITTDRTAGPDLIDHGRNGWLAEAGNTERLQQMVEELLLKPHRIAENGREAMQSARLRPWQVYGKELFEQICVAVDNSSVGQTQQAIL